MKHNTDSSYRITARRWGKAVCAAWALALLGITGNEANAFEMLSVGEKNRPIISALGAVTWSVGDHVLEETEKHSLRLLLPMRPTQIARALTAPGHEMTADIGTPALRIDQGIPRFTLNLLPQGLADSVPAQLEGSAIDLENRPPVVPISFPPSSGILFVTGLVGMLGTACWRDSRIKNTRDFHRPKSHRPCATSIVVLSPDMGFAKNLDEHLHRAGYAIRIAAAASEIITVADPASVALVLVDPRIRDWDMLRTDPSFRHVLLMAVVPVGTAYAEEHCLLDLERGMDGIHDLREGHRLLVAKVEAYLWRTGCDHEHRGVYQVGGVELDGDAHEVKIAGRQVKLSAKPFAILKTLMREPSKVFSRSELVNLVWGPGFAVGEHALDVHIHGLRRQLDRDPNRLCALVTIKGVGFKLKSTSAAVSIRTRRLHPIAHLLNLA